MSHPKEHDLGFTIRDSVSGLLSACLLGVLLLSGCGGNGAKADREASQKPVFPVTITHVAISTVHANLKVAGTVAALPNQDVRVSSLVPGRVVRLTASVGDRVRKGEILTTIDARPYQERLTQAQAGVAQAEANLENAQSSASRDQTLFLRGVVARKYLLADKAQVAVDRGALEQAQATLALAKLDVARTRVLSPLSGIVVQRFVSDGEQVDGTAANPLFEVANLRAVELYANVPASFINRLRVGQSLPVTTDALPGKTLVGSVVAIAPSVDPTTNVGVVRIRMENPGGALRLGMYLSTILPVETHPNALVIPLAALYRNASNAPEIYRVEGEFAIATPVTVGIATHHRAEILSGVKNGETIVATGGYGFGARTHIKVVP